MKIIKKKNGELKAFFTCIINDKTEKKNGGRVG